MSELTKLKEFIKLRCDALSLHIENTSPNNFRIFTDHSSGLTLFLDLNGPTNFNFHYLERTYDIVYHGDRSDAHVILSLMFACYLRSQPSGMSCSLFDIPHPVVDDEIWGRYIMPEQTPSLLGISTWSQLEAVVADLIDTLDIWRQFFWTFAGCTCENCLRENNSSTLREYELPQEISDAKSKVLKASARVNYGSRPTPDWSYYYNMKNEVTVIKSERLSLYLEAIQNFSKHKQEVIEGVDGLLVLDGEIKSFLPHKSMKELYKLTKDLTKSEQQHNFHIFPMENMLVAVANPFIIALGRLCGLGEFKLERERLRKRHNKESELLFPIALYEWQENVCPDQFEGLIKSLLEREINVESVRRASPINQGDRGRDLHIAWNIINTNVMSDTKAPTSLINVVGQCKASNKTIGKNKVLDIRDTVETHNALGYFLAVSTQISEPLTAKLQGLRSVGIWTEWWNRDDIEMRLTKNPDLLPLFPKVLIAKYKVKYVGID